MDVVADLYGHQAWADAEHWRALTAHPTALSDKAIRERLHHIHLVQRAFLWVVGDRGEPFVVTTSDEFEDTERLRTYAREYHDQIFRFLASATSQRMSEPIPIPWFQDPPLTLEIQQALVQAAMHSHYHRAQNATRLREIGGQPPLTDLILWYARGRPAPSWS
jgi:uncharacterized damage-inducible protein DinB